MGRGSQNTRANPNALFFLPPACGQRLCVRECGRSSGEAVAALGATALQHSATGAGAHAIAEPVLLLTTTSIGLECALHDLDLTRFDFTC